MTTNILILRHPTSLQEDPHCSSPYFPQEMGKVAEGRWWRDLSAAWGAPVAHPERWVFLCKYIQFPGNLGTAGVGLGRIEGSGIGPLPSGGFDGLVTLEGSDAVWQGLYKENGWLRKLPLLRFYNKAEPAEPWHGPANPPRMLATPAAALALHILDGVEVEMVLASYQAARVGWSLTALDLGYPGTWENGK